MDSAKLILEYIKTLIWPVILVFVIFAYEDDVLDLLKNREIDAFGLKIGQRIENISQNYQAEIADLKENIKNAGDNQALLAKVESIDKNIKEELAQVQKQTAAPDLIKQRAVSRTLSASQHERAGFDAILDKNITEAISQFTSARQQWPEYHNVSELEQLLKRRQSTLTNPSQWLELNRMILQKYSWGMPADIRQRFKETL